MACNLYNNNGFGCGGCTHFVRTNSVALTGGVLVLDIPVPQAVLNNKQKICICVAQAIPEGITSTDTVAVTIDGGTTYVDAGASVLDWESKDATNYNDLGFTLTTSGLPIDTSTAGNKQVAYTLKYKNNDVDTQTRTVTVGEGNYRVGDRQFSSLQAAIESISTTGTVELLRNCTDVIEATIPGTKNITLDLGTNT